MTLGKTLDFIKENKDEYGINRKYCLVFDWGDGFLYFLERDDEESDHQKDLDRYDEQRHQWPANGYDGKQLTYFDIGKGEGAELISYFLDYLGIEYLG